MKTIIFISASRLQLRAYISTRFAFVEILLCKIAVIYFSVNIDIRPFDRWITLFSLLTIPGPTVIKNYLFCRPKKFMLSIEVKLMQKACSFIILEINDKIFVKSII